MGSLARTREALLAEGGPWKSVFFWGHQPRGDGDPGPHCLSQWWPAEFQVEGVTYPTAEHFMMAEKARLFGDEAARRAILGCAHPARAKALGRTVANFEHSTWEAARWDIVVNANMAKFSAHPGLEDYLLASGERILVEASPVDRIWGIGLAADDPAATDPERWQGDNLLGFALMEVRARLRETG